jgi:TetR/AcrR family transcriptional regulator, transcriptional repressor for nem operon
MTNSLPTPLGRPRTFIPEEALHVALDVFWQRGYRATSLDDLTAAMGLSRSSFYAAFGSKQEVLLAAVRVYVDRIYADIQACENKHLDPLKSVRAMLGVMADPDGDQRGCLLVNSITELAPHIPEMQELARAHIDRVVKLLASQLVQSGVTKTQATARAAALMSCAFGVAVMRKAGVRAEILSAMLRQMDDLMP